MLYTVLTCSFQYGCYTLSQKSRSNVIEEQLGALRQRDMVDLRRLHVDLETNKMGVLLATINVRPVLIDQIKEAQS